MSAFPPLAIAQRLDIAVKYRLFRSLITGRGRRRAEVMYRDHIEQRTRGREPRNVYSPKAKVGLSAYVSAAEALLASMQVNGFDASQAVPMGNNGLPRNGAHRIACAYALGLEPVYDYTDAPGWPWDMAWFERHGFSIPDRLWLLDALDEMLPSRLVSFVLWGDTLSRWDEVTEAIAAKYTLAGAVDIAFPLSARAGFDAFVEGMAGEGALPPSTPSVNCLRIGAVLLPAGVSFIRAMTGLRKISAKLEPALWWPASAAQARQINARRFSADGLPYLRSMTVPVDAEMLERIRSVMRQAGSQSDEGVVGGEGLMAALGLRGTQEPVDLITRTEAIHRVSEDGVLADISDADIVDSPGLHIRCYGLKFIAPWLMHDRLGCEAGAAAGIDRQLLELAFSAQISTDTARWRTPEPDVVAKKVRRKGAKKKKKAHRKAKKR